MNIIGGEIRILDATDDGLNTGGADSGSHAMTISGGYIYVNASGDGVDSNGTWTMTGRHTAGVRSDQRRRRLAGCQRGYDLYRRHTAGAVQQGLMEYPESGCLVATNCNAASRRPRSALWIRTVRFL